MARRDGQLERPLDDPRQTLSCANDRCKLARLGRVVETSGLPAQPPARSQRLLSPQGESNELELSGVTRRLVFGDGGGTSSPPIGRPGGDRQLDHNGLCEPSRRSIQISLCGSPQTMEYDQFLRDHTPGSTPPRGRKPASRLSQQMERWRQDSTDLKLDPRLFRLADRKWGPHTVDLFATRLNTQLARFVSWRPDPEAAAVDAFQFPLKGENPWCFLPEALIPRLLGLQQSLSLLLGGQASLGGPISPA